MFYRLRSFKKLNGEYRYMTAMARSKEELSKLTTDASGNRYVVEERYK